MARHPDTMARAQVRAGRALGPVTRADVFPEGDEEGNDLKSVRTGQGRFESDGRILRGTSGDVAPAVRNGYVAPVPSSRLPLFRTMSLRMPPISPPPLPPMRPTIRGGSASCPAVYLLPALFLNVLFALVGGGNESSPWRSDYVGARMTERSCAGRSGHQPRSPLNAEQGWSIGTTSMRCHPASCAYPRSTAGSIRAPVPAERRFAIASGRQPVLGSSSSRGPSPVSTDNYWGLLRMVGRTTVGSLGQMLRLTTLTPPGVPAIHVVEGWRWCRFWELG